MQVEYISVLYEICEALNQLLGKPVIVIHQAQCLYAPDVALGKAKDRRQLRPTQALKVRNNRSH